MIGEQPIETAVPYSTVAAMDFDLIYTHMGSPSSEPNDAAFELTGMLPTVVLLFFCLKLNVAYLSHSSSSHNKTIIEIFLLQLNRNVNFSSIFLTFLCKIKCQNFLYRAIPILYNLNILAQQVALLS